MILYLFDKFNKLDLLRREKQSDFFFNTGDPKSVFLFDKHIQEDNFYK